MSYSNVAGHYGDLALASQFVPVVSENVLILIIEPSKLHKIYIRVVSHVQLNTY